MVDVLREWLPFSRVSGGPFVESNYSFKLSSSDRSGHRSLLSELNSQNKKRFLQTGRSYAAFSKSGSLPVNYPPPELVSISA